jgi:hypothetical protein
MSNLGFLQSTLDQVLVTSLADYGSTVTDNAYSSNTILGLLGRERKMMIDGGATIIRQLADEVQDDGGFYLGADTLNTTQSDTLNAVEYKWQNAYEPIQITRDEERQNSGDKHKLIDLLGKKVDLSMLASRRRIERAISTPTVGANNLVDLETMVGTGTLGSINGATSTFWQATVTTSGAFATQGLADMTTAYYVVSGGEREDNPTHFITNKTVFQKFEQTRLPLERLTSGGIANAGYDGLTFKGKPLFYGNHIGSGLMFGLNMNYIDLVVDSQTDFITTPFVLPTNQTAKIAFILWRGNMVATNRRRNFKLTSIS